MNFKKKLILGIETSCDETAAAVLINDGFRIKILSNTVASSASLQSKYGGIIPEQAAREQIKSIISVIKETLDQAEVSHKDLDVIAVTQGPGLIGSLLVGVETAKTLSLIWDKPLIPVNHLLGHFYANWIVEDVVSSKYYVSSKRVGRNRDSHNTNYIIHNTPSFPCLGLLASGGHTDLVLFSNHNKFQYLGGTRDDAAGECFDKCARLLGLSYPGGPEISKLAQNGNPKVFDLPRPMIDSDDFDLSFSGLKTAVANLVHGLGFIVDGQETQLMNNELITSNYQLLADLCASIEQAIIDCLVKKTILAAQKYKVSQIMIAGGVAANKKLKEQLQLSINNYQLSIKLHIPPPYLCTDNGAMIASRAYYQKPVKDPLKIDANPNLSLAY